MIETAILPTKWVLIRSKLERPPLPARLVARPRLIERLDQARNGRATLIDAPGNIGTLYPITKGRAKIEEEIFSKAASKLTDFGIELLDVRFKRINYTESVQQAVFQRMITERKRIAERSRSEGQGRAAEIRGQKEIDKKVPPLFSITLK